jgi:hypothetical protein
MHRFVGAMRAVTDFFRVFKFDQSLLSSVYCMWIIVQLLYRHCCSTSFVLALRPIFSENGRRYCSALIRSQPDRIFFALQTEHVDPLPASEPISHAVHSHRKNLTCFSAYPIDTEAKR